MTDTTCHMSLSLDGYAAGPDQSLGKRGQEVHAWHIGDPRATDADREAAGWLLRPRGAYVMGRNMFGPVRGDWSGSGPGGLQCRSHDRGGGSLLGVRDPDLSTLAQGRRVPGRHYRWLCPLAVVEIGLTTLIALLPSSTGGVPWSDGFSWKYVNYTPIVVGGVLLALWAIWELWVKNVYTGPRETIEHEQELADLSR